MTTKSPQEYPSVADYEDAYESFRHFFALALAQFVRMVPDTSKNRILGNLVSAAIMRLGSIFMLWREGSYTDCWILHRALVERYMHLRRLARNDEFEEFERWSIQRMFGDAEALLHNPAFASDFPPEQLRSLKELSKVTRERINREPKSNWRRPKAKDELKGSGNLNTIYISGYNFASMKVHPMHNDGEDDFARLILGENPEGTNPILVLHDSFVMSYSTVGEWLVASGIGWRGFVWEFYAGISGFLDSGSKEYSKDLDFALQLDSDVHWGSPFPEEKE